MTVGTADYFDAAIHLPTGGRLVLHAVEWEEYEHLLDQLGDSSHLRVSYNAGRLEIMSPSNKHEKLKNLINSFVNAVCYELNTEWLSLGSVTLKQHPLGSGAEADDCFYFEAANSIIRKERLNLATDPPPDIVVEIDLINESSGKLDSYASFGVPEVWRYVREHVEIMNLAGGKYETVETSRFFSMVTASRIMEFISECESAGQLRAQRRLRDWLAAVKGSKS
ncbi:MAG: Uma2 family endonuclease [Blastocatellia bacterium]